MPKRVTWSAECESLAAAIPLPALLCSTDGPKEGAAGRRATARAGSPQAKDRRRTTKCISVKGKGRDNSNHNSGWRGTRGSQTSRRDRHDEMVTEEGRGSPSKKFTGKPQPMEIGGTISAQWIRGGPNGPLGGPQTSEEMSVVWRHPQNETLPTETRRRSLTQQGAILERTDR